MQASRVLIGGVSYNEGGVQEGVSRRAIAVSLVHETEAYRSLTEVLESRRRELGDVRAMVRDDCARGTRSDVLFIFSRLLLLYGL